MNGLNCGVLLLAACLQENSTDRPPISELSFQDLRVLFKQNEKRFSAIQVDVIYTHAISPLYKQSIQNQLKYVDQVAAKKQVRLFLCLIGMTNVFMRPPCPRHETFDLRQIANNAGLRAAILTPIDAIDG